MESNDNEENAKDDKDSEYFIQGDKRKLRNKFTETCKSIKCGVNDRLVHVGAMIGIDVNDNLNSKRRTDAIFAPSKIFDDGEPMQDDEEDENSEKGLCKCMRKFSKTLFPDRFCMWCFILHFTIFFITFIVSLNSLFGPLRESTLGFGGYEYASSAIIIIFSSIFINFTIFLVCSLIRFFVLIGIVGLFCYEKRFSSIITGTLDPEVFYVLWAVVQFIFWDGQIFEVSDTGGTLYYLTLFGKDFKITHLSRKIVFCIAAAYLFLSIRQLILSILIFLFELGFLMNMNSQLTNYLNKYSALKKINARKIRVRPLDSSRTQFKKSLENYDAATIKLLKSSLNSKKKSNGHKLDDFTTYMDNEDKFHVFIKEYEGKKFRIEFEGNILPNVLSSRNIRKTEINQIDNWMMTQYVLNYSAFFYAYGHRAELVTKSVASSVGTLMFNELMGLISEITDSQRQINLKLAKKSLYNHGIAGNSVKGWSNFAGKLFPEANNTRKKINANIKVTLASAAKKALYLKNEINNDYQKSLGLSSDFSHFMYPKSVAKSLKDRFITSNRLKSIHVRDDPVNSLETADEFANFNVPLNPSRLEKNLINDPTEKSVSDVSLVHLNSAFEASQSDDIIMLKGAPSVLKSKCISFTTPLVSISVDGSNHLHHVGNNTESLQNVINENQGPTVQFSSYDKALSYDNGCVEEFIGVDLDPKLLMDGVPQIYSSRSSPDGELTTFPNVRDVNHFVIPDDHNSSPEVNGFSVPVNNIPCDVTTTILHPLENKSINDVGDDGTLPNIQGDLNTPRYITKPLLSLFFNSDDVEQFMEVFDLSGHGKIDESMFIQAVLLVYLLRKRFVRNVKTREGVAKLVSRMISLLLWFFLFILVLISIGVDLNTLVISGAAVLSAFTVALSYIYTNFINSVVFIAFQNPYNIGDRVRIDDGSAMYVKKIRTYTTEFETLQGLPVIWPNMNLSTRAIYNESRCKNASYEIKFLFEITTSHESIEILKCRVKQFAMDRTMDFVKDSFYFFAYSFAPGNYYEAAMWVTVTCGWGNWKKIYSLKTELYEYIIKNLEILKISYKLPEQKIHFTNSIPKIDNISPSPMIKNIMD